MDDPLVEGRLPFLRAQRNVIAMVGKTLTVGATLLAMALGVAPATGQTLPPEKGYRWERVPEIKAAFLVPDGWFFRKEMQGKTLGCFISREKIVPPGEFLVGTTINMIPAPESIKADQYAKAFIESFQEGKTVIKAWDASRGRFRGYGCLVKDDSTTMHTLMLANPETNTLYLIMFEAPNGEWQDAWRIGEPIIEKLHLDEGVQNGDPPS